MKKLKGILGAVLLTTAMGTSVYANGNVEEFVGGSSSTATLTVSSGQGWVRYTNIYSGKQTTSTAWTVNVLEKSMVSSPQSILMNSNDEFRSNTLTLNGTGEFVGGGNTGDVGYNYYIGLNPSLAQIGTDTIRLNFNAN